MVAAVRCQRTANFPQLEEARPPSNCLLGLSKNKALSGSAQDEALLPGPSVQFLGQLLRARERSHDLFNVDVTPALNATSARLHVIRFEHVPTEEAVVFGDLVANFFARIANYLNYLLVVIVRFATAEHGLLGKLTVLVGYVYDGVVLPDGVYPFVLINAGKSVWSVTSVS